MSDVAVPPAAGSPVGAAATGVGERRGLHPARHTGRSARMIGEVVVDLGFADQDGVDRAIELARQSRRPTGQVLVEQGVLDAHAPAELGEERRLALEHCLLLHHGPEAASGQRFAFAEALALYRLNALDAHLKSAFEHGFPRPRR